MPALRREAAEEVQVSQHLTAIVGRRGVILLRSGQVIARLADNEIERLAHVWLDSPLRPKRARL